MILVSIYLGANTEDGLMNQSSISSAYREGGTNSGVGGALLRNAGAIGKWLFYRETTLIIGYVRTSVNIDQKQPLRFSWLLFKKVKICVDY